MADDAAGAVRRARRDNGQHDILPGMPDALAKVPPKAREYAALTLDEAIARSHALLDEVIQVYAPEKLLLLFSGGNDSTLLAHLVRDRVDTAVHIRTTIAAPKTSEYVAAVCTVWGLPVTWADPPRSYRDLVLGEVKPSTAGAKHDTVWRGFPGPGAHSVMYQRLKERALDRVRRDLVGRRGRTGQVAYIAGTRWSESDRRWRNANEIDVAGSVVWVSPIVHWTEGHIAEYRERHRCALNHVDPAGSVTSMPGYLEAYVSRIAPAAARLTGVSLECQPALDLITRYGKSSNVLLYVDPPYLGSSRRWGNAYRHEMRTEQEHRDLAAVLHAADASVVLSGYDSPLYLELYPDWHVTRIETMTGQGGTKQERTEVLWSNRLAEPHLFTGLEGVGRG
ncbi:phosphoadenosine phosphosulfate reductase family protein [Amycolatopsis sp. cmx-4-83]|uniref:phosphoadenosine phosphosulfate reductase domain-containing protein n=1 Tax=Amycolatopsis sp. cmx-4-83 TaxID=2790940 RepID=UPI00397B660C